MRLQQEPSKIKVTPELARIVAHICADGYLGISRSKRSKKELEQHPRKNLIRNRYYVRYVNMEPLLVKEFVNDVKKSFNRKVVPVRKYDNKEVFDEFSRKKENTIEEVPIMIPGEVHVEYEKPGFLRRLFAFKRREMIETSDDLSEEEMERLREMESKVEAVEKEMTDLEEMEEEMEYERESLLSKIMSVVGFKKRYNVTEEEFDEFSQNEARALIDDDLKRVLKITHSWIEKLSADKKKAFKESGDFDLYKGILQKYGLIRAKTPKKEEPKETEEKKETKPAKKATKKVTKKK